MSNNLLLKSNYPISVYTPPSMARTESTSVPLPGVHEVLHY